MTKAQLALVIVKAKMDEEKQVAASDSDAIGWLTETAGHYGIARSQLRDAAIVWQYAPAWAERQMSGRRTFGRRQYAPAWAARHCQHRDDEQCAG